LPTRLQDSGLGIPSKPKYRADIDGLRAIAVVAVVAYHTGVPGFVGGFTGVDVFFVISGYLITGLLLLDVERFGRVRIPEFYARRVRRILPTLVLVVLTTAIASFFLLSSALGEIQRVLHSAFATLLMAGNFYFLRSAEDYFSVRSDFQPLLHTWSLSVEEQFYFVWPAAFALSYLVCARTSKPTRCLVIAIALLIVMSAACAVMLASWSNVWAFYLAPARGWELGIGGILAILLPSARGVSLRLASVASALGLLLIIIGIATVSSQRFSPLVMAAFPVLGTSLVIAGNTLHPTGTVGRILSIRVLVQIGLVSYAWYLWHWPTLSIARILDGGRHDLLRDCTISASTLAVSFVTLALFERPLRFRLAGRLPARWVVSTGCGVILVASLLVLSLDVWSARAPMTAKEVAVLRAKQDTPDQKNCLLGLDETTTPSACLASGQSSRLFLLGDSIAHRLAPALQRWASQHSAPIGIEVLTKSACPPLVGVLPTEPDRGFWMPYEGCQSFNTWVEKRLSLAGVTGGSGVLLSAFWWGRATDFDLRKAGIIESRHSFDVNARTTVDALKIFENALRSTLRQITDQGLRVVIVLQTPILLRGSEGPALDPPDCLFRKSDADCSMPLLLHNQLSNPVNSIIKKVAAEFSGVRVFDPIPFLCREERCSARVDGIIAYTDFVHLSATMSVALTEDLTPYLDWLTAETAETRKKDGSSEMSSMKRGPAPRHGLLR
jgi:peptidoglycan/LPS O-acetylase OafA/YrhL